MLKLKLKKSHITAAIAAAGFGVMASLPVFAEEQSKAPTTAPTIAVARSADAIGSEVDKLVDAVEENLLDPPDAMIDPEKRKSVAPRIVPNMQKIVADLNELAALEPDQIEMLHNRRDEFLLFLSLCGDKSGADTLLSMSKDKDPAIALEGKTQELALAWVLSSKDEATQTKVGDEFEKLAKAHPENENLSQTLVNLSHFGPASPDLADRAVAMVIDDMKNDVATTRGAEAKSALAAARQLASLEGKPLVISGTTPDGKTFTTADWKGKVILVDFWATWCGPCRAELPRVEQVYSDYHGKGLEVLGVSNDQSSEDLKKFVEKETAMAWPQLLDADAAKAGKWNPITTGFGINGIPTMFLIDKKGILRTVNARESMEKLIPKMLAE